MGIDLHRVFSFASTWEPIEKHFSTQNLPQDDAADLLGARVVDAIRRTSIIHIGQTLARAHKGRSSPDDILKILKTMRNFHRLRRRVRRLPELPRMGVREAFFEWLDADLRNALIAIYTRYFPLEPRHQQDRKSTRLNSSHIQKSRMPSSA